MGRKKQELEFTPPTQRGNWSRELLAGGFLTIAFLTVAGLFIVGFIVYANCRIDVPSEHMAIMIKKTGKDLPNDMEFAPSAEYKGVQVNVLTEGRYYYNPYSWDWIVVPQVRVPKGKLGVRIRLHGEELPPGQLIAETENQKGIVRDVLRAGTHAINGRVIEGSPPTGTSPYAECIEIFDPVTVPPGHVGVVTNLSGPIPDDPNVLLVLEGTRGVQESMLSEGTYYLNPYINDVTLVNCQSQRYKLSEVGELGFPTKDGFWVGLDGKIEFKVKKDEAASVFVTYNDDLNDTPGHRRIDEEIINKVILPNARSFARLRGSSYSGQEFIEGETRVQFQEEFQTAMRETCGAQGIEIIQAVITDIRPPEKIAEPVRQREIAKQEQGQYDRQIKQQLSEQELAIEQAMVRQKKAIVEADQGVVKVVTEAKKKQEVAIIEANKRLVVAQEQLEASKDKAAATIALGKADADVIMFQNEAEAAGWAKAVSAFGNNGDEFARWTLYKKIAPAYRRMMVNTDDSPIMDVFESFDETTMNPDDQANFAPYESRLTDIDAFLESLGRRELPVLEDVRERTPINGLAQPPEPAPVDDAPAADGSTPAEEDTPSAESVTPASTTTPETDSTAAPEMDGATAPEAGDATTPEATN